MILEVPHVGTFFDDGFLVGFLVDRVHSDGEHHIVRKRERERGESHVSVS